MANENRGPGFGTGLILGGIIGALTGLIFAPRPGEDPLAQFKVKTEGLRERAEELAAEARVRLRGVVDEGKAVAARMRATPGADSAEDTSPDIGG
jgi:gas vesicle protein